MDRSRPHHVTLTAASFKNSFDIKHGGHLRVGAERHVLQRYWIASFGRWADEMGPPFRVTFTLNTSCINRFLAADTSRCVSEFYL